MLVERNAVQQADIDRALQIQRTVGGRLGALLVRTGAISEDVLLRTLAEQIGALYLADADDLPDTLDMYRFMSASSIKLEWFLDNAVLLWQGQDEQIYCLARDIPDHRVAETLEYFYQPGDTQPDTQPSDTRPGDNQLDTHPGDTHPTNAATANQATDGQTPAPDAGTSTVTPDGQTPVPDAAASTPTPAGQAPDTAAPDAATSTPTPAGQAPNFAAPDAAISAPTPDGQTPVPDAAASTPTPAGQDSNLAAPDATSTLTPAGQDPNTAVSDAATSTLTPDGQVPDAEAPDATSTLTPAGRAPNADTSAPTPDSQAPNAAASDAATPAPTPGNQAPNAAASDAAPSTPTPGNQAPNTAVSDAATPTPAGQAPNAAPSTPTPANQAPTPNTPIRYCLTANHHLDRALDYVRKERAMENLFAGDEAQHLRDLAEQAPVIELVNNLLSQAVDLGASDIHVEPTEDSFTVRMRLDGVLHTRLTQSMDRFPAVASRIKLISGLDIAERRLPQDGRITERISGREMDIRVSTVPCAFGESIVLRLLAKERDDLVFDNLGMEPDHREMFRSWLVSTNGIILVTGPTGSGKSTTLAAALEAIDDGVKKIITVEDPVEYQMPNITQMQVHSEIGMTFARALRAILRQDPDVIMIGEIRDLETAEIAIRSALTGHVVLSTVHTNDAVSSFTRLIDMGVEPFLVAAPVRGVQAQRLVRKACPDCSVSIPRPALVDGYLDAVPAGMLEDNWVRVEGCDRCRHTGYRGRTGIYEMVPMTESLQDMIVAGAHVNELKRAARKMGAGCRTLVEDGLIKASRGETTVEELMRAMVIDAEAG